MKRSISTIAIFAVFLGICVEGINACEADFSYTINKFTVTFNNNSTDETTTTWTINDQSVALNSSSHKFKKAGTYKVCLDINAANIDCKDQVCKNLAIGLPCEELLANFEATTNGYLTTFTLPTDAYESVKWNFGDGTSSTKQNPTHQYQKSDTYTVTLSVQNGDCSSNFSEDIRIRDERIACKEQTTKYLAINRIWRSNCGEKNANNEAIHFIIANQSTTTENLQITWSSRVKWQGICSDKTTQSSIETINKTIKKGGKLLVPKNGYLPAYAEVILFASTELEHTAFDFSTLNREVYALFQCAGNTESHFISTAKKRKAAKQTLSIRLAKDLEESITFDGSSLDGEKANVISFDLIGNAKDSKEDCIFSIQQTALQLPSFEIKQKGLELELLNTTKTNYKSSFWELGNNNFQILNNPLYTYSDAGTYTVALVLELENGDCVKIAQEVEVKTCDIEADFTFTTIGSEVELINLSDGNYDAIWWATGEGNEVIKNKEQLTHNYASQGTFKVCLTVQSAATACEEQVCKRVEIVEGEEATEVTDSEVDTCDIEVGFDYNVDGLTVQFNNYSTGNYDELLWDFGDGKSSSKENPSYTYEKGGEYFFTLTVLKNNDKSCKKTFKGFVNVFE